MSNIPKQFDWVSARKNCNTREMFKRLFKVVRADCNIAQQTTKRNLKFSECSEEEFSVVDHHASGMGINNGVAFILDRSKVQICDPSPPNKVRFTLRAYLLDGGDCTFIIDDKTNPLHPWQVSRLALEDVFFSD